MIFLPRVRVLGQDIGARRVVSREMCKIRTKSGSSVQLNGAMKGYLVPMIADRACGDQQPASGGSAASRPRLVTVEAIDRY
jgi:hypothetical protein